MVVFGGRSGEHEVSLASARAIMEALKGRHEVVPVGITRAGRWISSGDPMRELEEIGDAKVREIETSLGYPCFVKPTNLGSSVGINRATEAGGLRAALDEAA